MTGTKIYGIWGAMLRRCRNPRCKAYPDYGGRGIAVCDRWLRFENFFEDMGERPDGSSLDRIDNDEGYSPENCRWRSLTEQGNNKRNNVLIEHGGEFLTPAEWSRRTGIKDATIRQRIRLGWTVSRALGLEAPLD